MLRYVLDVWFFLALTLHARTQRTIWIVACGLINGVAMLWELDTGVYLLGVSVFYHAGRYLLRLHGSRGPATRAPMLASSASQLAAAAAVTLAGWAVAGRGRIDGRFLRGVFESITTHVTGMACVPMKFLNYYYIFVFIIICLVYIWPMRVSPPACGPARCRRTRDCWRPASGATGCAP